MNALTLVLNDLEVRVCNCVAHAICVTATRSVSWETFVTRRTRARRPATGGTERIASGEKLLEVGWKRRCLPLLRAVTQSMAEIPRIFRELGGSWEIVV